MRRVAGFIYDQFQLLDLAGPFTAFEVAGLCGVEGYELDLLAPRGGLVATTTGLMMQARDFREAPDFDILLVPGGRGLASVVADTDVLDFVRRAASERRCVASVCSGAFVLAATGLLSGRRATTHWGEAAELARKYPDIEVDPDSLFIENGNIWTAAGVTAGIDMALALIEKDYGSGVARAVARAMVVSYRRPGSQSQQSALLNSVEPESRFSNTLAWARARLSEPLDVDALARQAGLSPRQFSRTFRREVGITPAKAIEWLRVESARSAIESGARSLERVAREHGFMDPERMRRAFIRTLGEPPQALRRRADNRAKAPI